MSTAKPRAQHARIFAALGDKTRLALVTQLANGERKSITQLTRGSRLTRQAVTKHLRALEKAGVVASLARGRESLFTFNPRAISEARGYLDFVSRQWDNSLARLKFFAENND